MGITEPAIFGVNLRFFKPFIAGCIGGGCGALYASIVHLGARGTGVTGIFGILLCLDQPVQYLIEMVIAVTVAFAISFVLYKDQKKPEAAAGAGTEAPALETSGNPAETPETTEGTSSAEELTEETITSPVAGTVVPTDQVSDETFASELLGTTVAVEPSDGKITAPCSGEVMNIFDTGHAVCLTTESGAELLIHVGIDTVKLDGKGFTKKVSDGDKIHAGDVLIEADLDQIRAAGYPATTMVILTNADQFSTVEKAAPGETGKDQPILKLKK